MRSKAIADGMIPRFFTVTPSASMAATPAFEAVRVAYNAWLLATYPGEVYDIAPLVTNPVTGNTLKPEYYGDGTHYPGIAKITLARWIASQSLMNFTTPSAYQRICA